MSYKIAIVGMGPKGLFALERLIHEIHSAKKSAPIIIYIFEKSGRFGSGAVYDPDQPEYLMMNYPNRNIDVGAVGSNAQTGRIPSFIEFLAQTELGDNSTNGFSPRGLVGKYLGYCFDMLASTIYDATKVVTIKSDVKSISKSDGRYCLKHDNVGGHEAVIGIDQVLLTTGHDSWKGMCEGKRTLTNPEGCDIPYIYPITENLRNIPSSSIVAIKGLGLTFIDAVLGLTEGRGGAFRQTDTGKVLYEPSGLEPKKIVPFSKSGLPMVPRKGTEGSVAYRPRYFTIEGIRDTVRIGKCIELEKNILPLLKKEVKFRYYRALWKQLGYEVPDDYRNEDLETTIENFHQSHSTIARFAYKNLYRPVTMERPDLEISPLAYYRYILMEAEKGSESSPLMAAALTWGKVSNTFNGLYSFGGLTANAHREFDTMFRSKLNRISYGPPLQNAQKVLALMEHGIVDMNFAVAPQVRKLFQGWSVIGPDQRELIADILIDARIPNNGSLSTWSGLFRGMRESGLIREYINQGKKSYSTACPEIDRCGRAVGLDGHVDEGLTLYGTPTEGMTYDNDTLSRERNNFASAWALRCVEESNNRTNGNS